MRYLNITQNIKNLCRKVVFKKKLGISILSLYYYKKKMNKQI